jgi:thioredoxin-like negative regulator of GroEL
LRHATIIVAALIVSGCALVRPAADPMSFAVSRPQPISPAGAPAIDPDLSFASNFEAALSQAREHRRRGELEAASRVVAQLVVISPDDPRAIGEYGKIMLASGRTDDAVAFLERATTLEPTDWTLFSALGVAYDQQGKRSQAQASFNHALIIRPGEPSVLSNLALSHMQAGELDEAERLFREAGQHDPGIPGLEANLAEVRRLRAANPQRLESVGVASLPPRETASQPEYVPLPPTVPEAITRAELLPAPVEMAPTPLIQGPLSDESRAEPVVVKPSAPIVADAARRLEPSVASNLPNNVVTPAQRSTPRPSASSRIPRPQARPVRAASARAEAPTSAKSSRPARPRVVASAEPAPRAVSAPAPAIPRPAARVPDASLPSANATGADRNPVAPPPPPPLATNAQRIPVSAPPPPPRDSWESMVRVSLPVASTAINPPVLDPPPAEEPPPSSGWFGGLMAWLGSAFAYITGFWS